MFKMTSEARTMKVYNFQADTKEYIGESDAYIAPYTGLPVYCTEVAPGKEVDGYKLVFNGETWLKLADHRGTPIYDIQTGIRREVEELGELPDGVTTKEPKTTFDEWNGTDWVKNEARERQQQIQDATVLKRELTRKVSEQIEILSFAVNEGIATDDEEKKLKNMQIYRYKLNNVDVSQAPSILWPEP
ncbi:tail fiber assembly protein [Serratia symbiotica]|uniref:Phage tail assembly protein n=2 Tax=Serratia symbiotica TaxID=138074 RepID=A0A068Z1I4_9GAMM|nr:tail fiber assembly protein [Serratia symbiotica]NIH11267.1 tail fiber assembly protein [Serratia symbiotica]QLH62362.1 tail fiber assembly protein [Serratia symbiotica]BBI91170.1 phage tail assembly protein [Serratia symbiotica]CDS57619.1 putative tail fibre chaperone; Qin prophage [Serratia symbiotica]